MRRRSGGRPQGCTTGHLGRVASEHADRLRHRLVEHLRRPLDERQDGARVGQLQQQARHLASGLSIGHAREHQGEEALAQAAATRLEVRRRHVLLRRVVVRVAGVAVVSVVTLLLALLVVLMVAAPPRAVSPPAAVAPAAAVASAVASAVLLVLRGREERGAAVQVDPR